MKKQSKFIAAPGQAFAVTGTYHGSIVFVNTEGEARRAFHRMYNGESITNVKKVSSYLYK